MEGTEENVTNNSEIEDLGLVMAEQDHTNSIEKLELKNPSGCYADDKQNLVTRNELNGSLYESENEIQEPESTFMGDSIVLDDDFLVDLLARSPGSGAVNCEHLKDSEKERLKKKSEGNIFESTKCTSIDSQGKEGSSTHDVAMDQHNKSTAVEVTELISSPEFLIDKEPDADAQEISVINNQSSNPTVPMDSNMRDKYRCDSDSWSSDDDNDSSTSDTSSDSDFCRIMIESSAPKRIPVVKTKGELGLEDLPPIEDLIISVEEKEMTLIGKIHAVVDKLVVIHAIKDMKPLDLDSVLFLSHDKPLGRVFDVFGPVVEPFYCVRFNTTDDISVKSVVIGSNVFFAPEKPDITTYVFVDELQRQKGSDASWKHNNEPPEQFLDFSDDEEEKAARRKRVVRNRNHQFSNSSDVAPKRPFITGGSSQSNYRNFARPASPKNFQFQPFQFPRHNPFSNPPIPPPSPSPSICNVMSMPVQVQNSFNYISPPSQPHSPFPNPRRPFLQQNILQRSSTPVLYTTYQQPHVFGQMTLLSPMATPLRSPSPFNPPVLNNIPALVPQNFFNQRFLSNTPPLPPPMPPQNYFNQRFPRNPSPVPQSHRTVPDPWISNRPPESFHVPPNHPLTVPEPWISNRPPESFHVPPNHPLTVQIPNQNGPSESMPPTFQPNSFPLQPFVNNNITFPNGNVQSRFY